MASQALKTAGYKVEPFFFSFETWSQTVDFVQAISAHLLSDTMIGDLRSEYESLLEQVKF